MSSFGADNTPFTKNMAKSDDPIFSQLPTDPGDELVDRAGRFILFWNIFDSSPQPPAWRPRLGCFLTFLYLLGVIAIVVVYLQYFYDEGRPTIVHSKYVSSERVLRGDMSDYVCQCKLPPQIQDDAVNDTRINSLNRCYDPEEVRNVDILQFGLYTRAIVNQILDELKINTKPIVRRVFDTGYSLNWESYELMTSGDINPFNSSDSGNPLANLSSKLENLGYIGQNGFIGVQSLAGQPFFTMPQGFIRANVDYNCTSCTDCENLWAKYSFDNATRTVSWVNQTHDIGWIFCYNSSQMPSSDSSPVCTGSCRFFRTHFEPWGIAMNNFAVELLNYIPDGEDPPIFFQSRLLYANISHYSVIPEYEVSFMEIERTGTMWARILDDYSRIPECTEKMDEAVICNGTSICESAPVYSPDSINSESVKLVCTNYATVEDFQIDQKQCADMEEKLNMKTHGSNGIGPANVCEPFQCQKVQSAQVYWDNYFNLQGEVALSNLMLRPSFPTLFIPALCSNNYTQVYVHYTEGQNITAIYEMNCTAGRAQGCWMTGLYKNVNDTRNDAWKHHTFSPDEMLSGETMFACYRFDKKSVTSYLYDKVGIVAGIIGSWLLVLSCIFWTATRTRPFRTPVDVSRIRSSGSSTRPDGLQLNSMSRPVRYVEPERRSADVFNNSRN